MINSKSIDEQYLVLFVNDLRIFDEVFVGKLSDYVPMYYPSKTVRDNCLIPQVYQPLTFYCATLGMIPTYDPELDSSVDSLYNPWEILNAPGSIMDTLNDHSQLYQMGVYIISDLVV